MTDTSDHPRAPAATPAPPPAAADVPSWRLLLTLGGAGVIAGLLIVLVYRATQPRIQAHKAQVLREAIEEVLKAPEHYETLYVLDGALTARTPEGVDARKLERVYLGYRQDHQRAGFAIATRGAGFQDMITLIFGFDAGTGALLGMRVLESKETPGLGDKIEKDSRFVSQFERAKPPLTGVKPGAKGATDPGAIVMITGATISSRAVIRTIDTTLARLRPLLEAYREEARP